MKIDKYTNNKEEKQNNAIDYTDIGMEDKDGDKDRSGSEGGNYKSIITVTYVSCFLFDTIFNTVYNNKKKNIIIERRIKLCQQWWWWWWWWGGGGGRRRTQTMTRKWNQGLPIQILNMNRIQI